MQTAIYPGKPWFDTDGKRIQAHGGAFIQVGETFYWYGENKEDTDGKNGIWTSGIRYYSSKDFCNWKDEGFLIPPEDDENSPLHPTEKVDRPHILYNETTKKYICWVKNSGEKACFFVFEADQFTGPYVRKKDNFRPFGREVGDFDIAKDEETGKAYLFFDADHSCVLTVELTRDYLDVTENYVVNFDDRNPPFCREGITHFVHDGKHYLLTSGMSGYIPNPSEVAVCDSWMGKYEYLGNPHVNDESNASFNSQVSAVYHYPGSKDLYLVLADRWVPEYVMTKERVALFERVIGCHYDPEKYQIQEGDKEEFMKSPFLGSANTSIADYVLLPITWEGDMPTLQWKEEWSLKEYLD